MKTLISLILLCPLLLHAQNNPIFQGGTNDGAAEIRTERPNQNPIFNGGSDDGFAQGKTERPANSQIFGGGRDDGYSSVRLSRTSNNDIFNGGSDDGYHIVRLSRASNNPIYAGGIGDGYDSDRVERQSHNPIFAGGVDDGYDLFRFIGIPPSVNPNLPVEILSFEAWWERDQVAVYWVTASEDYVDYFEVERSSDARLFGSIVRRGAEGNPQSIQEYEDLDSDPLYGRSYYRLKAVDIDGALTYSPIVSVFKDPQASWELSVFPNPTQGQVELLLNGAIEKEAEIVLTDFLGRRLSVPRRLDQTPNLLKAQIDLSQLPSGIYVVSVRIKGSDIVISEKVYKQ